MTTSKTTKSTTRRNSKKPKLELVKDDAPAPKRSRAKKPKLDQPAQWNPTITMTWDGETEPCWTGVFDELAKMNALDPALDEEVLDEMRAALREHGEYRGGGGAAPIYSLAVVQPASAEPTQPELPAKPKRSKRAQTAQELGSVETEPQPPKRTKERNANAMTLAELSAKFLAGLESDGKSDATVSAYRADLSIAQRVLGADTPIDAVRPEHVAAFNESDAVLLTRAGTPKAAPSYLRTQRVLRLALDFAEAEGWIVTTPCVEPD